MIPRNSLLILLTVLVSPTVTQADVFYTSHFDEQFASWLGTVDTNTGTATPIGSYGLPGPIGDPAAPTQVSGALSGAFDTDGTLYTIIQTLTATDEGSHIQLATVDRTTGTATPVGATIDVNMLAMEIDDQGTLWATGFQEYPLASTPSVGYFGDTNLYRLNKETGVATVVGDTGVDRLMDMAFDSHGILWATTGNKLWTINTDTGAATLQLDITGVEDAIPASDLLPFQEFPEIMGIAFGADDTLYANTFTVNSGLFTVDTTTGAATLVGRTGMSLAHGADIFVPEPSSLTILSLAMLGVLLLPRRRQL